VKVALGRTLNERGTEANKSNTPQPLVDASGHIELLTGRDGDQTGRGDMNSIGPTPKCHWYHHHPYRLPYDETSEYLNHVSRVMDNNEERLTTTESPSTVWKR
jgi:hypothetical protein